jgi:hypothetical protein
MTVIRTNCPRCGEVDLGPKQVTLAIASGGQGSTYAFTCPGCDEIVEKPADRKTVAILVSAGVDPGTSGTEESGWLTPDRDDIEPVGWLAGAPPFTLDDVIDFHFLLLDDIWLEECLTPVH